MSLLPPPTNRRVNGVRPLNNWAATRDPATTDNQSTGYWPDSKWFNETSGTLWICTWATIGEAIWIEVNAIGYSGDATPTNGKDYVYVDRVYGGDIIRIDGTTLQTRFQGRNSDADGPYTFEITGSDAGPEPLLDESGQVLLPNQIEADARYTVIYNAELAAWQVMGIAGLVEIFGYASYDQDTPFNDGTLFTDPVFPGVVLLKVVGGVVVPSSDGAVTLDMLKGGSTSPLDAGIVIAEGDTQSGAVVIEDPDIDDLSSITFTATDEGEGAAGWWYKLYVRRKAA